MSTRVSSGSEAPIRLGRTADDAIRAIVANAQSDGYARASVPVEWLANLFAELDLLRRLQTFEATQVVAGMRQAAEDERRERRQHAAALRRQQLAAHREELKALTRRPRRRQQKKGRRRGR